MKKITIEGFENEKITYNIPEDSELYTYSANGIEEPFNFLLEIRVLGKGKLEDCIVEKI